MRNIVKWMFTVMFFFCFIHSKAQDSATAQIQSQIQSLQNEVSTLKQIPNTHFMVRGFAQFGTNVSSDNMNFNMTSFNPVLLWRHGDRFLFESELEMEYMTNQLSLNLGYANASYLITNGLVVKFGKILIPFGTFGEKLHPSWVNKCVTMPLGVGHDGMVPLSDIGFEIRGGVQIGSSKLSYAAYVVNGPTLKDGTVEPKEAGMLAFENAVDNNNNKAFGGRIGFLPFSNSSLEIGFSGYSGRPGSVSTPFPNDSANMDLNYKSVKATLTAFDISYVKYISFIKGVIDVKGQYSTSNVSKAVYLNQEDSSRYTFSNMSTSYYAQIAYRPAMLDNLILQNLEFVTRYSGYKTPEGSLWYNDQTQLTLGLNYWFNWRTVLKANYQITNNNFGGMISTSSMSEMNMLNVSNQFLLHLAVGF